MPQWVIASNGTLVNLNRFDSVVATEQVINGENGAKVYYREVKAVRFVSHEEKESIILCSNITEQTSESLMRQIVCGYAGIDLRGS